MLAEREDILGFLKNSVGIILVLAGLLLIVFGLLNLTSTGSLLFAFGLFFGLMLIIGGLIVHFDWFPSNIRSKDGFGSLLMCISPFLIASGLVCFFITQPNWSAAVVLPQSIRGRILPGQWIIEVPYVRVYLWLAILLPITGTLAFAVGFFLRVLDNFF